MMGLFIVSLLMTLLLQLSDGNPERKQYTTRKSDDSVPFGEFCLHVSDNSQWTSSTSGTQQPTKSANTGKEPTQHPKHRGIVQLKQANRGSSQQPATTSRQSLTQPTLPYVEVPEIDSAFMFPVGAPPVHELVNDCHCNMENMKDPAETSSVRSTTIVWPTKICNSMKVIEMLENGREVCVNPPSISEYIANRVLRPFVTTAAPLDPTTELPTTTQPSVPETTQSNESFEEKETVFESCESCSVTTDLDNVDINDIEFLDVKRQSFMCSLLIYLYSNVSLNDGNGLCLDQDQQGFWTMVKKLEERFYQTREKITDGCHCEEQNMQAAVRASEFTSTRVRAPTETCNTTEFIQTLMNGSEVCVNPLSLSEYIDVPRIIQLSELLPDVQFGRVAESLHHITEYRVVHHVCPLCAALEDWKDLDPNDVESMSIEVLPLPCPILISVKLKTEGGVCVSSDQPNFSTFIKKMQDLAH
ncbi:uncharacterized protein [Channa argus]|uniref:uncharacterized protein isoform X1 n=1 Tax=Channa argus TaxID=215402 RepID=UPI00294540D3|nr:hypothetical protein Q8A73_013344 [Channa argus]